MLLRLSFIFALLFLGCSNPYERDNPTDYVHVYTVTFSASEATSGTPPVAITGSYNDAIQLPGGGNLERAGYVFGGWGVSSHIITGDTTLNAVWIPGFSDSRDNQIYKTVVIGTQTWMAENLNYNAEGSKCYGNSESNCVKYGRLYNWSTARTVCPSGWHLPSHAERGTLMQFLNPSCSAITVYCDSVGTKLKATSGWNSNGNGTDDYGFSALPGGNARSDGIFFFVGDSGYWWSSTEYDSNYAYYWYIHYDGENAIYTFDGKSDFNSVRCVKNSP